MYDHAAVWELLCEFTRNENLRKHALAVEACLRAYARKWGEDENLWGVDRKSTRLNSSHIQKSRMPSSA